MFSSVSRFFLLALVGVALFGCSSAPEGNPTDGKRWYLMHNCNACHGDNGDDGDAVNIKNLGMSFNSFVKKLRVDDAPIMPHFPEEKISEQDAADIYAFLKE